MGKRKFIQQELLGNLDSYMQFNETRTHPHTMHQNKLKMAERLKYKTRHHQTPGREQGKTFSDINLTNIFSGQSHKATEIRAKIVLILAQWLANPTKNHGVAGSIPGLSQWFVDPAFLWAVVWVTDAAQILHSCGSGIGQQLQL